MSTALQTNQARAISLINSIESLGGSAGYRKNPAAFEGTLPATDSKDLAEQKAIVLEVQKISLSDAYGNLNALKAFAQNHNDERVRKIALPLKNVKIDAEGHAASVQSVLSKVTAEQGENKRNLKLIQGIERLGGSAKLQKYLDSIGKEAHTSLAISTLDNTAAKVWYASAATVSISSSFWGIIAFLNVVLDDGSGSGVSFNSGDEGGETFAGTLFYRDIEYMASELNTFSIEEVKGEGVPPACILWYIGEEAVASFLINDSRFTGMTGIFSWSPNAVDDTNDE